MPRPRSIRVELVGADREWLTRVVRTGTEPARRRMRAQVLLALDENAGPVGRRADVAAALGVSQGTVLKVATAFVASGGDVAAVIERKKRTTPPVPAKVTGEVEARLIALACSTPPQGYARWSLRLLEKHVALIDGMPDLSDSTIERTLKKRSFVLI